jgi:hypothetical protein
MEGEPVFVTYARAPRSGLRVAVGVPFEALAGLAAPEGDGLGGEPAQGGGDVPGDREGEHGGECPDVPAEIEAVSAELARAAQIQRERAAERERAAATLREEPAQGGGDVPGDREGEHGGECPEGEAEAGEPQHRGPELARAAQIQRERAAERERAAATLREETQRLEVMNASARARRRSPGRARTARRRPRR